MERLSVRSLRKDAGQILDRVSRHGDRVVLHRRNKDTAVIVSMEDYAALRQIEDQRDLALVRKVRREINREGTVSLEAVKKRLGLK